MSDSLLKCKEKAAAYYGKYSVYIDLVIRFAAALITFLWIRSAIGADSLFSNLFLILVLALLCSVFPYRAIPVVAGILVVGQAFSVGPDVGVVSLAVILILLIFFLRFVPDDAFASSAMMVLTSFGLGALTPLICGIRRRSGSIVAVLSGSFFYALVTAIGRTKDQLASFGTTAYTDRLGALIPAIFSASAGILAVSAVATTVIVYLVSSMRASHAFAASAVAGSVSFAAIELIGSPVLGASVSVPEVLIGTVVSCVIALIYQAVALPLDYSRSETFQMEDDSYYYYVKAVPKQTVDLTESETEDDADAGDGGKPVADVETPNLDHVNFEKKLEDSLKDL